MTSACQLACDVAESIQKLLHKACWHGQTSSSGNDAPAKMALAVLATKWLVPWAPVKPPKKGAARLHPKPHVMTEGTNIAGTTLQGQHRRNSIARTNIPAATWGSSDDASPFEKQIYPNPNFTPSRVARQQAHCKAQCTSLSKHVDVGEWSRVSLQGLDYLVCQQVIGHDQICLVGFRVLQSSYKL